MNLECWWRTDAEAEVPILWPPDRKNWLIRKDHDAGKDWRQEEKGKTEDEMVGWHHQLNGQEFEQALGIGDGQGSLVCHNPWGRKESYTTEQQNWTKAPEWLESTLLCVCFCNEQFTQSSSSLYQITLSNRDSVCIFETKITEQRSIILKKNTIHQVEKNSHLFP